MLDYLDSNNNKIIIIDNTIQSYTIYINNCSASKACLSVGDNMNMTDIHDMFHEYLDATNLQIFIEDMEFIPSEVLLKFPKAYDKLFDSWFDRQEITWVNTIDDDGYYKFNSMLDEDY